MEWPLIAVAVLFAITYACQVLGEPAGATLRLTQAIVLGCWAVFAVDYVARLILTSDRRRWFFRNLLSLLVVVLPILRPLRLVRLLTLFTVFQRAAGTALRGRVVVYAAASTVLLVFVASLAVLDAAPAVPQHHSLAGAEPADPTSDRPPPPPVTFDVLVTARTPRRPGSSPGAARAPGPALVPFGNADRRLRRGPGQPSDHDLGAAAPTGPSTTSQGPAG